MRLFGILVVLGFGWYGYAWYAETRDVARLCSAYPKGAVADGLLELADDLSAKLMGPIPNDKSGSGYKLTYCSPITMCDVSCSIEVRDGVVIASDYFAM